MSKLSRIDIFGTQPKQGGLFIEGDKFSSYYPPVYRDIEGFKKVLNEIDGKGGLDFEFPPTYKASIIGISSYQSCAAVPATPELVRSTLDLFRAKNAKIVGHSVIGAEKKVIEVTTGVKTYINEYDDSMLKHYLLNADLAKAPDKGEVDDAGALGFMNLWTSTSLVLDVPNWKYHRGNDCEQIICPSCDVKGYCAVDSWASLAADAIYTTEFKKWRVPNKLYEELKELTWIAEQMTEKGVKIDMPYVNAMEKKAKEYKEELFADTHHFNPRANEKVVAWFKDRNIILEGNTKKDIQRMLVKKAVQYGFETNDEAGKFTVKFLAESEELPETLDALYRLYEYKSTGKGLDPWFADKYRDADDFIHPRFITIGASTSRWSSSKPNFTNIPARGFGSLVRAAIVPRDSSLDIVHADASNLELRVCTYLADVDPAILGKDPFAQLVERSSGLFDKAAALTKDTPRGVAKTVSHASNYGEGIKILYPKDLNSPHIQNQIKAGALYVYKDWEFCGGVVAFTGANLAERLFGDKSYENRKKALMISEEIYFKQLPFLRDWHRKVLKEIDDTGMVRYPTGHFLRLYGNATDNAKMGLAALGQGVGAHHIQGIILRYSRELQEVPILFVHDALDFEIPQGWTEKQAKEFISMMGEETDRLPGFKTPYKAFRGQNGLEFNPKKIETHIPGAMLPLVE